jgi:hypothetical protein
MDALIYPGKNLAAVMGYLLHIFRGADIGNPEAIS